MKSMLTRPSHSNRPAWCRASSARQRRTCPIVCTISDQTVRIKGDIRKVHKYLSDCQRLPDWYPGVSALTLESSPGTPNPRFNVVSELGTFKLQTRYQLQIVDDKRIIYTSSNDLFDAKHQFLLMPDRHNSGVYTVVRYLSEIELTEWKKALQPIVGGLLSKIPEAALENLSRTLNGPDSPLQYMTTESNRPGTTYSSPHFSASSSSETNSGSGNWGTGQGGGGWNVDDWSPAKLMDQLSGWGNAAAGWVGSAVSAVGGRQDPRGFYAALQIDYTTSATITSDDVRSAFRKAAQQWHPDKFVSASPTQQEEAGRKFAMVQKAYEVLRDDELRRKYDVGQYSEEMAENAV